MSRLSPRRFVGETAAVRLVDQRQERVPAICVKTGVPTDGAVRVRACDLRCAHQIDLVAGSTATVVLSALTRRPTQSIVVPVDKPAWRRWRRRLTVAVALTSAGVGLLVVGLRQGNGGAVVLSVIVVLLGLWMRYHSCAHHWISLRYRPERGDVISIVGVHPRFAAAARELFVTSVRQHPDSG